MKINKPAAAIFVVFICVAVVFAIRLFRDYKKNSTGRRIVAARSQGNPKAALRIIEYTDFQCPACARAALLLENYIKRYPQRIYLEAKYFPLSQIHIHAFKSALYAECASRQGKFWEFYKALFESQKQWAGLINAEVMFKDMAKETELDLESLSACVASEGAKTVILDEKEEGQLSGVSSTPTFFINDKMIVGPKPLEAELTRVFGGIKK